MENLLNLRGVDDDDDGVDDDVDKMLQNDANCKAGGAASTQTMSFPRTTATTSLTTSLMRCN